jgi:chemotaxis protein CheX
MTERMELPPILDLVAAPALHAELLRRRGVALELDAGRVRRLGGQCLQILLAARAIWAAEKQPLRFTALSEEFIAALEVMGVSVEALTVPAPAGKEEVPA